MADISRIPSDPQDGSSLELIEELVGRNPGIRILLLTGYASIATAVSAIKMGAFNYLSKPVTVEQIISAFEEDLDAGLIVEQTEDEQLLSLRRLEWEHIQQVLQQNHGNISATARQLRMHRRTLQRKLGKRPHTLTPQKH